MTAPTITRDYAFMPTDAARELPYGWGTISFLADGSSGTSPHVSMARVTIRAGGRNVRHLHPNCDELLYLLSGHLRHLAGKAWIEMRPGETIRIARGVPHQAEVVGAADAEMIVVYSVGDRETQELPD